MTPFWCVQFIHWCIIAFNERVRSLSTYDFFSFHSLLCSTFSHFLGRIPMIHLLLYIFKFLFFLWFVVVTFSHSLSSPSHQFTKKKMMYTKNSRILERFKKKMNDQKKKKNNKQSETNNKSPSMKNKMKCKFTTI